MRFEEAVKIIYEGKSVKRKSWEKSQYIFLDAFRSEISQISENGSMMGCKLIHFFCVHINNSFSIWHPTQDSMQANDWEVVE